MEQLYSEYKNSIEIQKNAIKNTTEKLKVARIRYNYSEVKRLNALLKLLYEEKWEMEEKVRAIKRYLDS